MPIDKPNISLSITPAQQLAGVTEQRVLIVAQMLAAGSATDGDLYRDFPNDGTEDALFGIKSQMAALVRAFKVENQVSNLDVIPLDDSGTATDGTAVITLGTGPAGETTTIDVIIGSENKYKKTVAITLADTITDIGDAIVAAFDDADLPFALANNVGVVTATAENGGTLTAGWGLAVIGSIDSVTIALTAWVAGTNDPVLTSVLDVIGSTRYQTVLWPANYDLTVIEALLNARFNISNDVLDGVVIQVKHDTLANLKSYASQNSQSVVIAGQKLNDNTLYKGPTTMEFPDVVAAQICAIRALRRTNEAVLTQYLTTVAPKDQFGSLAISSLPYFNTLFPNLISGQPENDFSRIEINELIDAGIATYGPNRVYNSTIFGEFVTTYLTDSAGNPDESYQFLNTVDTASVIREFFFTNLKSRYAQTRLTDGSLIAGRDMANVSSIRTFCNRLYDNLAEEALVQKGVPAKKDYNQNLVITIDVSAGSAVINQAPLLVSQLRVILGTIQINFGG